MENFNTFIKKILLGDKSIHDPILVRITNTTSENIPFMEYLLKYKNINKNNLLESLHAILNLFRKKFHSLHNDNDNIKELFSNVKNEWHLDENDDILNLFKSSINSEFFSKYEKCKLEYNKGCNLCDELIELDENESNIPIESIFQNELPINRKASGLLFLCNDIYKFIEGFIKKMELILNEYKSYKNSILIDLSTRLKSCYNCNNIPNNIHTIFMNYIIIHNFFYKELMNIYYQLLEYLNKIKENCEIMTNISENNNEIAKLDIMNYLSNNYDNDDNDDNDDNEQQEYYDPNILLNNDSKEQDDDIIKKISDIFNQNNSECGSDNEDEDDEFSFY